MSRFVRYFVIACLILAVPCLPFLILGEEFEQAVLQWTEFKWPPATLFSVIVGVLATDILLPVPSSAVNTYAGAQLGILLGTCAAFLGMTLGSLLGFTLARWGGPRVLRWFTTAEDINRLAKLQERWSVWLLLVTRPLPILAEACVVFLGALQTPWRVFFPTILISNVAIALIYAVLGKWAAAENLTTWALVGSILIPLLLTYLVRHFVAGEVPSSDQNHAEEVVADSN
ncbi:MAG: VTT domain-containing protein [Planctomycetaceae bacterium]|nr:VTT domain-containing protein [Planctomycetaceae bacterium]MCB9951372.1 VTT domain-containing protein [Planctomycetaceae bacterium]